MNDLYLAGSYVAGIVIGTLAGVTFVVFAAIVTWYFYRNGKIKLRSSKPEFNYDTRSLDRISVTSEELPKYNTQRRNSKLGVRELETAVNSPSATQNGESGPPKFETTNETVFNKDNSSFTECARPSLQTN